MPNPHRTGLAADRIHGRTADTVTVPSGKTLAVAGTLTATGTTNLAATNLSGTAAFTGAVTTTDGVASGTARKVGGLASASVAASTAITGATETETNFSTTYTMPAGTLKVGTVVKIRAQGIHTATTGSETHSIILKLGTTALCTIALVDPADNDIFYFDFMLVCRTSSATGTVVGCGVAMAAAATAAGDAAPVFLASTTVDCTAAQIIAVAIDRQGTATDSDSARLDILAVEVLG